MFYLVLLVCHNLNSGQVKSVKPALKQLQQSIQNITQLSEQGVCVCVFIQLPCTLFELISCCHISSSNVALNSLLFFIYFPYFSLMGLCRLHHVSPLPGVHPSHVFLLAAFTGRPFEFVTSSHSASLFSSHGVGWTGSEAHTLVIIVYSLPWRSPFTCPPPHSISKLSSVFQLAHSVLGSNYWYILNAASDSSGKADSFSLFLYLVDLSIYFLLIYLFSCPGL